MSTRHYSFLDRLLNQADQSLRTLIPGAAQAQRPSPAQHLANVPMDDHERQHIAGLMRINHTGEGCAQALYQGGGGRPPGLVRTTPEGAGQPHQHLQSAVLRDVIRDWCNRRADQ